MITKYLIEEQTLTDIANSIRTMEGSNNTILVEEYASRITSIEPTTEEYMRLSDLFAYPTTPDEAWYTQEDITKVNNLIKHFESLGGDKNGK